MIRTLLIALAVSSFLNLGQIVAYRAAAKANATLTADNTELRRVYADATAEIERITARATKAEAAATAARAKARTHETRALAILQSAPSNPADACASADAVITAYLMERQASAH